MKKVILVSFYFNSRKTHSKAFYEPCDELKTHHNFKSAEFSSPINYLNSLYKNKDFVIFTTDKTRAFVRNSKHRIIYDTNKDFFKILKDLSKHLLSGASYIIDVSEILENYALMMPILNLAKLYDFTLVKITKQSKTKYKINKISTETNDNFSNISYILSHFKATLKAPMINIDDTFYKLLRYFSNMVFLNNPKLFVSIIKDMQKELLRIKVEKNSIFYPFVGSIEQMFDELGLSKIKLCSMPKYGEIFSIFDDYFTLARMFLDRGYYLNAAILMYEGINYGLYTYIMQSSSKKYSYKQKMTSLQMIIRSLPSISLKLNNLKTRVILKDIDRLSYNISDVRNTLTHINIQSDFNRKIKDLDGYLNELFNVFSHSNLAILEQDRFIIASEIERYLNDNFSKKKGKK